MSAELKVVTGGEVVSLRQIQAAMRACRLLVECDEVTRAVGRFSPDLVLYSEAVRWAREALGDAFVRMDVRGVGRDACKEANAIKLAY